MAAIQSSANGAYRQSTGIWKRIGDMLQSIAVSIHYARTMQALCNLSDAELKELGITRSDIPSYAQRMVDEGL